MSKQSIGSAFDDAITPMTKKARSEVLKEESCALQNPQPATQAEKKQTVLSDFYPNVQVNQQMKKAMEFMELRTFFANGLYGDIMAWKEEILAAPNRAQLLQVIKNRIPRRNIVNFLRNEGATLTEYEAASLEVDQLLERTSTIPSRRTNARLPTGFLNIPMHTTTQSFSPPSSEKADENAEGGTSEDKAK